MHFATRCEDREVVEMRRRVLRRVEDEPQGGLKTAKPDWAAFIFCGGIGLSFSAKPKKKNGGDAEITVNTR